MFLILGDPASGALFSIDATDIAACSPPCNLAARLHFGTGIAAAGLGFRYNNSDVPIVADFGNSNLYLVNVCNGTQFGPVASDQPYRDLTGNLGTATTPVTLSYFSAAKSTQGVHFKWQTATEAGNAGFYLFQQTRNGWQRINDRLIPSHVIDSVAPQLYEYDATGVGNDNFRIVDVDIKGRKRTHGPYHSGEVFGSQVRPEPIDWEAIRT